MKGRWWLMRKRQTRRSGLYQAGEPELAGGVAWQNSGIPSLPLSPALLCRLTASLARYSVTIAPLAAKSLTRNTFILPHHSSDRERAHPPFWRSAQPSRRFAEFSHTNVRARWMVSVRDSFGAPRKEFASPPIDPVSFLNTMTTRRVFIEVHIRTLVQVPRKF